MATSETTGEADPPDGRLVGPVTIAIRRRSWRGPLARTGAVMTLGKNRFDIVNAGAGTVMFPAITLDPLRSEGSGIAAAGAVSIDVGSEPWALAPGASAVLVLEGAVPARPGTYGTTARLPAPADLAIPIVVTVPAAAVWGIGCMMMGLILFGVVNFLAGEGAVQSRLRDALQARQSINGFLERHTVAQGSASDVARMNRDFDRAIGLLSRHRSISIVDHRGPDAEVKLRDAEAIAARLHAAAGEARGAAEVAEVRHDWQALAPTLRHFADLPAVMPPEATSGLASRLDAFLWQYRDQRLRRPAIIVTGEISIELDRMALDEAAGEGDAAQALAVTTRLWLRRSARAFDRSLTSYRLALVRAGWMLNTDQAMRRRVARDDMAPQDRQAVLGLLAQAEAALDASRSLAVIRDANRLIDQAWTAQVRGAAKAETIGFDRVITTVKRQTDISDVQALLDRLNGLPLPHTVAMKQAGFSQVLDLWRAHAGTVDDPATRAVLLHRIAAIQTIVDAGAFGAIGAQYRILQATWSGWGRRVQERDIDRLQHGRCLEMYADLERDTGMIEATLREAPSGRHALGWDRALDRIRLDMNREGPDSETVSRDCATPLVAIEGRTVALSGAILANDLEDVPLPALTRVRLAQASGIAAAIEATTAERDRPRRLAIEIATPVADRTVGRELDFRIGRIDPLWGSSALVRVAFGDGSPVFRGDAEQLRQGEPITHRYGAARTVHVVATVREAGDKRSATAAPLGRGDAVVLVRPSPVSAAQRLADEFLNLRFGLALLIALTVYYWRYQSRTAAFGARGYDYVEAFALGFAADAAVSHLPQVFAGLVG